MVKESPPRMCEHCLPFSLSRQDDHYRCLSLRLGSPHGQHRTLEHPERPRCTSTFQNCRQSISLAKSFSPSSNVTVLIMSDNMMTVFYINNRKKWALFPCVAKVVTLWNWCISNWITLSVVYLPGNWNALEDSLSRHFDIDHKWELHCSVVNSIFVLWGTPSRDLFASQTNK